MVDSPQRVDADQHRSQTVELSAVADVDGLSSDEQTELERTARALERQFERKAVSLRDE